MKLTVTLTNKKEKGNYIHIPFASVYLVLIFSLSPYDYTSLKWLEIEEKPRCGERGVAEPL